MDIAFVTQANCIRVSKEAIALKNLYNNVKIHLITSRLYNNWLFDSISYYENPYQLKSILERMSGIDIFQVHNEPSYMANIIRNVHPSAKIIMDMHDSYYWRVSEEDEKKSKEEIRWFEEDAANSVCDSFIVVSPACHEELKKRIPDKPIAIIPSACPLRMYTYKQHSFRGGLVSQGGHVQPNEDVSDHWRDYTELFTKIIPHHQVWIYSASVKYDPESPVEKHYLSIGCKLGSFNSQSVIDTVGCHTWNLVGNYHASNNARVWDFAWPNKMFDAMAAGTPSVCIGAKEAAKFIEDADIGIVVDTPEELLDRWNEHSDKRVNVMNVREKYSMETYIPRLMSLYKEVLCK